MSYKGLGDLRYKARDLIALTKPRQLALLMFTMYGAYFAAGGGLDLRVLSLLTITGAASIGGVTALNMYLDMDIDSAMRRTSKRPLPSGRLRPGEAMMAILLMLVIGVVAAAAVNEYLLFTVLAGLYFDIIAYTELSKRFTPLNIVLGSVAGSMPALGGWAAATGGFGLGGILLAGIVFAWQPMHVWFLGFYFEEDYRRAGVPILPTRSPRLLSLLIAANLVVMAGLLWLFVATTGYGHLTALASTALVYASLVKVWRFAHNPDKRLALSIFKFATPVVALAFALLPVEELVAPIILS